MNFCRKLLVVTALLAGTFLQTAIAQAADGPTLLKRTVMVKLHRFGRYWPNPTAKEPQYNTFCWVPNVQFDVLGPVPGGSQFVAEFMKSDGSAWLTANIPTNEIAEGNSDTFKTDLTDDIWEKKAVTGIGTFPFRIRLKNELLGKNDVFFSGKYEVTKYPPRVPDPKNKMDFCTVEDWRAPIGFLWLNPRDDNANVPPVSAQMWFRGDPHDLKALLFKDGKQLADASSSEELLLPTPGSEEAFNWTLRTFTFAKVRGFNKDTSANNWDGVFFLDKNPGDYEIKVLRDGKLARMANFSVGADGKIADNGIATSNKLGGIRMVLPVSVLGTADGPLKADNWKTHAFYGNSLQGFTGAAPAPTATTVVTSGTKAEPAAPPEAATATTTEGGPKLLKSTLVIRADRMQRYWKQPETDNYWSWMPEGRFFVLGPIPAGTKFIVDFTKPDGSAWYSVDCPCEAAAENEMRGVAIAGSGSHMDKRGITDTGTFGFKIRYANEATGAKGQLMSGKFSVEKFHKGNDLPAFKNQFEYFVNHDWLLPIGYLWTDWLREPKAPPLHVNMWIKNSSSDNTKVAAYVFFNGKQLSSTKDTGSAGTISSILTAGSDETDPTWYLWDFNFSTVRGWNTDNSGNRNDSHFLDKNPGEYEVKVLFNGSLIRVAKFTVGADGKIVDNGIVAANKIGGISMILPVKVQGTADGKWNADAWKTQAFYGNPLQGFTSP